jgi:Na+/proline symporter
VLFGGAIITIGFTFFFGTRSLPAQTAMTGALSLLIFAVLFVIVTVNRPFTGSVSVRPDALVQVLEDLRGVHALQ